MPVFESVSEMCESRSVERAECEPAGVAPQLALDLIRGAAGFREGDTFPGALSILKGAVPDRARGLGHMAPTYFRREPGIDSPTAFAAPHDAIQSCFVTLYYDVDARHKAGHDGKPALFLMVADVPLSLPAMRARVAPPNLIGGSWVGELDCGHDGQRKDMMDNAKSP